MCGIVGYWCRTGAHAEELVVQRMMGTMGYRGPNDRGTYANQHIALGHLRLSILDLSPAGHQPFISADSKGILVYNGEIYNYLELKELLKRKGVEFTSRTDTEVLLYALHLWGPAIAVRKLNGMFAFAYYDARENTLWLARDRLGIKPLHVAILPKAVVFASEIKALLAHPYMPCKVDENSLATFLTCEFLDGIKSPFKDIEALAPGCLLKIREGTIEEIPFFDIIKAVDVDRLVDAQKLPNKQCIVEVRDVLMRSVSSQLISDARIATFCSGGLDSSLVTAYAKQANPDIVGYVANVEGAKPEYLRARQVGEHLTARIECVDYSTEEYLRDWPVSVWHSDMPSAYPSDQAFMGVAKACRQDGIAVALTGEGADELFGGYPWQLAAWRLWRNQRRIRFASKCFPPFRWLLPRLQNLTYFDSVTLLGYTFARYPVPFPQNEYQALRHACVEDGAIRYVRYQRLFERLAGIKPEEDRALLCVCIDDMYGHLRNLLHRNDRMGMAASVECRVPFLDNCVIDCAIHLPARYKIRRGISKWILKQAGAGDLPYDIIHANKIGFHVSKRPYQCGIPLLKNGVLAEIFKWNSEVTQRLLLDLAARPHVLFGFVSAELWARVFLWNESPIHLGERLAQFASVYCGPGSKEQKG